MKFRVIKFPGSPDWYIQLSERPAIFFDVRELTLEGHAVFYLHKPHKERADAEAAIKSLIRDWKMEAGEWQ